MPEIGSRLGVVWALCVVLFVLLWARLFGLQVIMYDYYREVSDENRIQLAVDMARRGLLRDREGRILAQNEPSYSVYLMRSKAQPRDSVIDRLAKILDRDTTELLQRIRDARTPAFEPVRLARHVPLEQVCLIEEQNELLPGSLLRYETTRRYPDPAGGGHLLGYLTEASGKDDGRGVDAGSFVGVRGAEHQFDHILRGHNGVLYLEVTAGGQVVGPSRDHPASPSIPGADVELTVDWELQRFAYEALSRRGSGSVVCIDPRSGEILALVNSPSFDPNLFSGTLTPEEWQVVSRDTLHPFLDRAIAGLYPPGSTTKLVTAAAGLEYGLIAPSTTFAPCYGGMQFGNRYFRCWNAAGHGTVNLTEALEQSCDVYFYQLAQRIGVERWSEYARKCGFGGLTGIDLPDESSGLVPDSAWYNQRYGRRGWTSTLVLNLGIGQGEFLTTPLQLARFFAAIANDGFVVQPHVFRSLQVESARGIPYQPGKGLDLHLRPETVATLKRAARQVVAGPRGTARVVNFPDLAVAGKTGTAQNPHGDNHSWFACYAPADAPEFVVVALVENSGQGSEVAAPLCGEVLRFWFKLPPLPAGWRTPAKPAAVAVGDAGSDSSGAGRPPAPQAADAEP